MRPALSLSTSTVKPCSQLHATCRSRIFAAVQHSKRGWQQHRQRYFQTESVPVGSSGAVSLDIFSPSISSSCGEVLLYFPRGPIASVASALEEPSLLQSLADRTGATTLRLNYRLSGLGHARYPTPVHDVGAAWQWIESNVSDLSPMYDAHTSRRKIGVIGEFIGGSLAAMLALTSCHLPPVVAVTSAYLGNPILDWTMMTTTTVSSFQNEKTDNDSPARSRRKRQIRPVPSWMANSLNPALPASRLLALKHSLFATPQYPYDPFASPMLFFKTPATPEPTAESEEDEFFAMMQATAVEEDHSTVTLLDSYIDGKMGLEADFRPASAREEEREVDGGLEISEVEMPYQEATAMAGLPKKDVPFRRSYRRWPPNRSRLALPRMHIVTGSESPLRDMAAELSHAAERSVRLYGSYVAGGCRQDEASSPLLPVELEERPGLGDWDQDEVTRIAAWFRTEWGEASSRPPLETE